MPAVGFLPIEPGFGNSQDNNTAPVNNASPYSLNDSTSLLQNIAASLQILCNRLCPPVFNAGVYMANDGLAQVITIGNNASINSVKWSFSGGPVYVYLRNNPQSQPVPDYVLEEGTGIDFFPDLTGITQITVRPQAETLGTVTVQRY